MGWGGGRERQGVAGGQQLVQGAGERVLQQLREAGPCPKVPSAPQVTPRLGLSSLPVPAPPVIPAAPSTELGSQSCSWHHSPETAGGPGRGPISSLHGHCRWCPCYPSQPRLSQAWPVGFRCHTPAVGVFHPCTPGPAAPSGTRELLLLPGFPPSLGNLELPPLRPSSGSPISPTSEKLAQAHACWGERALWAHL